MRVYDNVNNRELGQNTPMGKFTKNLKKSKKMSAILEIEYELTNKSDNKGNVSQDNFINIMKKLGHASSITEQEMR